MVGIILASAFHRLLLYEAACGFSRLRAYTHIFMLWLAVLLAAVVVLEVLRRQRAFASATLLAAIDFAVTLNLLNVDAFIVRQNVARAAQGKELDVAYLASLSADYIPALAAVYQSPVAKDWMRESAGAALACMRYSANQRADRRRDWREFHLAAWQAERALKPLLAETESYQMKDDNWPVRAIHPSGRGYPCWSIWMGD